MRARPARGGRRALREHTASRFTHVMVDEFQDTNPLQHDILELVERDNLFTVGDEHQSIYLFRDADVKGFMERRACSRERRARGEALGELPKRARAARPCSTQCSARCGATSSCGSNSRAARTAHRAPSRTSSCSCATSGRNRDWGRRAALRREPQARHRLARGRGAAARAAALRARGRGPGVRVRRRRRARARRHRPVVLRARAAGARACPPTWSAGAATGSTSRSPTSAPGSRRSRTRCDDLSLYTVLGSPLVRCLARLARGALAPRARDQAQPVVDARGVRRGARPTLLPEADREPLARVRAHASATSARARRARRSRR